MTAKSGELTTPKYIKFLFGGSSGMLATLFVQPLDLVKNRMQMSERSLYRSTFHAITAILKSEGLVGIYSGLSAGLLRQATYTTTRLGVYTVLFERFRYPDGSPPEFVKKIGISITAGLVGSFFGNPAELALIRMTSDGRLPPNARRGYRNAFDALYRVAREEGLLVWWRGCGPTMMRAAVVNAAQLTSYSQAKQYLLSSKFISDGLGCHFLSSLFSAFVTTVASLPVDIVKTRYQNMRVYDGVPEYRNPINVFTITIAKEGYFSLWKGFTPYFLRLGPHTILTFIILEQMNKHYMRYVLGIKDPTSRSI